MRVLFDLTTTLELPDADKFPPREEVEKALVEIFEDEGATVHGLEITNYRMLTDEQEDE